MKKKETVTPGNVTISSNVVPVYSQNKKPVDAAAGQLMVQTPTKKLELVINNVKIEIGDNVRDVNITDSGINIVFK